MFLDNVTVLCSLTSNITHDILCHVLPQAFYLVGGSLSFALAVDLRLPQLLLLLLSAQARSLRWRLHPARSFTPL